ncbi:MAG: AIR synthase-related protein [Candidatus Saccharibacteria bacterium]
MVLNAYWSAGSYDWLGDRELAEDFIKGWRKACDMAGVVWGGGETQSLSGIVMPGALEFAGSAFGIVRTERQLMRGARLRAGDTIVLIESSGVHANGISLIRAVADKLPDGYRTELPSGISLGESLLTPTHIYAQLMKRLFEAGLDIHYVSNITGHGWRKLMRAVEPFTYTIERIPPAGELFDFIAEQSGSDMHDMYGTFNMGAGFAIYAAAGAVSQIIQVAEAIGLRAWEVGHLEKGPKQVVIKPLDITFGSDSLEVR